MFQSMHFFVCADFLFEQNESAEFPLLYSCYLCVFCKGGQSLQCCRERQRFIQVTFVSLNIHCVDQLDLCIYFHASVEVL